MADQDRRTILVVVREPNLRVLFELLLRSTGFRAELASGLPDAAGLMRFRSVDLILTDATDARPSGLVPGSLETFGQIAPDVPIVICSTCPWIRVSDPCRLHLIHVLPLPFETEELLATIDRAIASATAPALAAPAASLGHLASKGAGEVLSMSSSRSSDGRDGEGITRPRTATMPDDGVIWAEDLEGRLAQIQQTIQAGASESAHELFGRAMRQVQAVLEELRASREALRDLHDDADESRNLLQTDLQRYRQLFWCAPYAYLLTDALGIIREANRAAADLLGVEPDRLVSKPLAVYVPVHERPTFRANLRRAAQSSEPCEWTTTIRRRSVDLVPAVARVSGASDGSNREVQLRWQLRKQETWVTASAPRAAERENNRVEGDSASELETRVERVLRDLRNPMLVILDQLQYLSERLLCREAPDPVDLAGVLSHTAMLAADTVTSIDEVRDALDLERGGALVLESAQSNLTEVVQRVVSRYQAVNERCVVRLVVHDSTRLGMIGEWDEARIESAIGNVVAAAIRDSGKRRVVVEVGREPSEVGPVAVVKIAQSRATKAGEAPPSPGFTDPSSSVALQWTSGRVRGESLGLGGARRIFEEHGGTLVVQSPGGSRVIMLTLPFNPIRSAIGKANRS